MSIKNIHLEICNKCNLRCRFCPVGNGLMKRKREFMPFELVRHVILKNYSIKNIGLSNWGEPLLHYDLFKILRYLDAHKKRVTMTTNATLLDDYMSMKLLVTTKLHRLDFSVDAVGTLYEEMRGFDYLQVKTNILNFLKLRENIGSKIECRIRAQVSELNESFIYQLEEEWGSCLEIQFQPLITYQYLPYSRGCTQFKDKHLAILSNGDITPCCVDYDGLLKIGNVKEIDLEGARNRLMLGIQLGGFTHRSFCSFCTEYESSLVKKRFSK